MPLFGSSSSSSSQGGPSAPAPPSLPRAPRPERSTALQASASQSHVDFLFSQVRACLHQLHLHGNLLARDYSEINSVLDRTELKQDDPFSTMLSADGGEADTADQLGKRNAWMRQTLEESMLLPAIVEAALSVTAGPFLSGNQSDAIISLVERSQKKIAHLVTNPSNQRVARDAPLTGAKVIGKSLSSGYAAARDSSTELLAKRAEQAKARKEAAAERKALREELKREREEIRSVRAKALRDGTHSNSRDDELEKRDKQLKDQEDALGEEIPEEEEDEQEGTSNDPPSRVMSSGRLVSSPTSASQSSIFSTSMQRTLPPPPPGSGGLASQRSSAVHSQNAALASVQCVDLSHSAGMADEVASSAATTTFSPWPGLLLTNTLVVASGDPRDVRTKAEALAELTDKDGSADVKSLRSISNTEPNRAGVGPDEKGEQGLPVSAPAPTPGSSAQDDASKLTISIPAHQQATSTPGAPFGDLPPQALSTSTQVPPPTHESSGMPQPHMIVSSAERSRPAPPPPAPVSGAALDPTNPPPFGTVMDTTEKKKGKKLFGK